MMRFVAAMIALVSLCVAGSSVAQVDADGASAQSGDVYRSCAAAEDWNCAFDAYATEIEAGSVDPTFCDKMQEGCGYIVVEVTMLAMRAAQDEQPDQRLVIARRGSLVIEGMFPAYADDAAATGSMTDALAPLSLTLDLFAFEACVHLNDTACMSDSATRITTLTDGKTDDDLAALIFVPLDMELPFDPQSVVAQARDITGASLQ